MSNSTQTKQNTSTPLFSSGRTVFQLATLKTMMTPAHQADNWQGAKDYFTTYFAKTLNNGFIYYKPVGKTSKMFENLTTTQMNDLWKQIPAVQMDMPNGKKVAVFQLSKWFLEEYNSQLNLGFEVLSGDFYTDEDTGEQFVNQCQGFLHKTPKTFSDFPQEVRDKVQLVLNHIRDVWNSGNEDHYQYNIKHIAHACSGRKMKTAVFLKSGEGAGKSIILEFIVNDVIGESLGLITGRSDNLNKFNAILCGKIFLVLEELPAATKAEWHSIADILKHLITGKTLTVEKKHQDPFPVLNHISLYICTNNENTIKFGKEARRYFMCDISHDKVDDTNYWNNLVAATKDKTVGEAFFWYLRELAASTPDFDEEGENRRIMTETKMATKEQNMTPLLQFLKDEFVKHNKGVMKDNKLDPKQTDMLSLSELHNMFLESRPFGSGKMTLQKFHQYLKQDIPQLEAKPASKARNLHVPIMTAQELKTFFVNKGYWNDKFDSTDSTDSTVSERTEEGSRCEVQNQENHRKYVYGLEKANHDLREEIEALKEQLREAKEKEKKTAEVVHVVQPSPVVQDDRDSESKAKTRTKTAGGRRPPSKKHSNKESGIEDICDKMFQLSVSDFSDSD